MPAKTKRPTQEEMKARIARKHGQGMVEKLKSRGWQFTLDANAPPEALY